MYAEVRFFCHTCNEHKLVRFGNQGLPASSIMFQIEIQGVTCPACGYHAFGLTDRDYYLIEDRK